MVPGLFYLSDQRCTFALFLIWPLTSDFLGWCFLSAGIQTDSVLSARLQIIRIYIREDGRLVIEFKTHAKFRGQCLLLYHTYTLLTWWPKGWRETAVFSCEAKDVLSQSTSEQRSALLHLTFLPGFLSSRSVCPWTPHSAGPQVPPDGSRPPRRHRVRHSAAVERSDLWLTVPAVEGHQLLQQVIQFIHSHNQRERQETELWGLWSCLLQLVLYNWLNRVKDFQNAMSSSEWSQ